MNNIHWKKTKEMIFDSLSKSMQNMAVDLFLFMMPVCAFILFPKLQSYILMLVFIFFRFAERIKRGKAAQKFKFVKEIEKSMK